MAQPQSELSTDEGIFAFVSLVAAVAGAFLWYYRIFRIESHRGTLRQLMLGLLPLPLLIVLRIVLSRWADPVYVIGHSEYETMFFFGGACWIWLIGFALPLTGLSVRDDALERNNFPAALAACGTISGSFIIYCGANIGGGPTIWTTLAPAAVATIGYLLLSIAIEVVSRPSETIAVDRDPAAAIRQICWQLAAGVILARAVAGDWWSWDQTYGDLVRQGSPAVLIAAGGAVLHIIFRPSPRRPRPPLFKSALIPGAVLIAASIAYVIHLGKPEVGKHVVTYEEYERTQ